MTIYMLRRLLQSVLFLFLSSLLVYTVLVMILPEGPQARYNALLNNQDVSTPNPNQAGPSRGDSLSGYQLADLEKRFKLDKPWPLNYFFWLFDPNDTTQLGGYFEDEVQQKGIDIKIGTLEIKGSGVLTGDLGESDSYARNVRISELFGARWVPTVTLLLLALALAVIVAVPMGVISALRHRSAVDHTLTFLSFAGLSVAPFVLGLLLIVFLAVLPAYFHNVYGWTWLPFLPPGGIGDERSLGSRLAHIALPAVTLAIPPIAWLSRYARASMLDVLKQDYIRTAWAKGLSSRRVVFKHALRNALLPLITMVGLAVPAITSGAIVVETLFAFPGMGQLYYRSIGGCLSTLSLLTEPPPCPRVGYYPIDYPLALSMTLMLVAIITVSNVLTDILYTTADPRVDLASKARS